MASRNGHGAHEPARRGRSRLAMIVVGADRAARGGVRWRVPARRRRRRRGHAPSPPAASASPSIEPTASDQVTPTPSVSASPSPEPVLVDGRHFVFARSAKDSPASLRFDLAEFLTDEAAQDAAEEHGDEAVERLLHRERQPPVAHPAGGRRRAGALHPGECLLRPGGGHVGPVRRGRERARPRPTSMPRRRGGSRSATSRSCASNSSTFPDRAFEPGSPRDAAHPGVGSSP